MSNNLLSQTPGLIPDKVNEDSHGMQDHNEQPQEKLESSSITPNDVQFEYP